MREDSAAVGHALLAARGRRSDYHRQPVNVASDAHAHFFLALPDGRSVRGLRYNHDLGCTTLRALERFEVAVTSVAAGVRGSPRHFPCQPCEQHHL